MISQVLQVPQLSNFVGIVGIAQKCLNDLRIIFITDTK